ncbi:MAG TPA: Ig-like domain-containing protein, partial [Nitrososphaeraceae archaeon]|nr:Ig-like domain-containing protein [Nitrososphaeraceae archaeon]
LSDTDTAFVLVRQTATPPPSPSPSPTPIPPPTSNLPPVANAGHPGPDMLVDGGSPVTLDGSASHDPDGDQLTFSWLQTAGPTVVLNGANTARATFTAPSNLPNDTMLLFKLTVTDTSGLSDSAVQKVAIKSDVLPPPGPQPKAEDKGITIAQNTPVDIILTGNDTRTGDSTGNTLTFFVVDNPQHGILTPGSSPNQIRYIPDNNYSGSDGFTYIARDKDGASSNKAVVSIIISTSLFNKGIIHGAMVDYTGSENVSTQLINQFNNLAGKKLGIVYFSDNWFNGIHFPLDRAISIRNTGAIPFIRMQNWKTESDRLSDIYVTNADIAAGKVDSALTAYAQAAKNFGSPLMIEYGVEINGNWFPWSQEGPAAFVSAYKHIINIFRNVGATNVKFALHLDTTDNANGKNWYPGDNYIDWVGTSCYGAPGGLAHGCIKSLEAGAYDRLAAITSTKPLGIFEWGIGDPSDTINTLTTIPKEYPRIKLVQVWNEPVVPGHPEDNVPDGRINVTPQNLQAYRQGIANQVYVSTYHD